MSDEYDFEGIARGACMYADDDGSAAVVEALRDAYTAGSRSRDTAGQGDDEALVERMRLVGAMSRAAARDVLRLVRAWRPAPAASSEARLLGRAMKLAEAAFDQGQMPTMWDLHYEALARDVECSAPVAAEPTPVDGKPKGAP